MADVSDMRLGEDDRGSGGHVGSRRLNVRDLSIALRLKILIVGVLELFPVRVILREKNEGGGKGLESK